MHHTLTLQTVKCLADIGTQSNKEISLLRDECLDGSSQVLLGR